MGGPEAKVAVVCGASRGIGKGIALELGRAGAHVVAVGRTRNAGTGESRGSLDETVAEITDAGGTAWAYGCDATEESAVTQLFADVAHRYGRLDIVVNSVFNAHLFTDSIGLPFWELPMTVWQAVVDVGTKSAYIASVAATPLLIQGGGLIVNISGRGAERYRYNVVYGVGKAALDRMTRDMAEELRPHGVAVVSLWPNVTRTENLERDADWARASFGDLGLLETPRYVGRVVAAIAADPAVMEYSGRRFWVAELAGQFGLTDENGLTHPIPE